MSTYELQDPFESEIEVEPEQKQEIVLEQEQKQEIVPEPEPKQEPVPEPEIVPEPEPVPESKQEIVPEQEIVPDPEPEPESTKIIPDGKKHQVYINFKNNTTPINCTISATNTKYTTVAANKELRLLQNRFYFIPVSVNINSDEFNNLKIFSDMADNIDIRYIKDNTACIMALKHNILIKDNQRLCAIW